MPIETLWEREKKKKKKQTKAPDKVSSPETLDK
jgi:hypothetical protein